MKISSWPEAERPRERLLEKGAQALSDAELLAVLLRNGVKGKDAVSLARELLAKHGGLRGLLAQESKALKGEKGLGQAKAAPLIEKSWSLLNVLKVNLAISLFNEMRLWEDPARNGHANTAPGSENLETGNLLDNQENERKGG